MASAETIEVGALLAPIAGGDPCGESLLYSDVYAKIQAARRGTERSQFETEARPADWRAVVRLGTETLSRQSKDLQVAVWLVDALTKTHGFAGLRDGLQLLRGLHETYWDQMHPVVEDGDLTVRANRLAWMNDAGDGRESLAAAIGDVPLTDPASGIAYGWIQWRESRDVGNLARQSAEKYEKAIAENRVTPEQFDAAVAAGTRRFYEALFAAINATLEECGKLEALVAEKYGREAPSLLNLRGAIEECQHVVERIVEEKRRLEPDPGDGAGVAEAGAAPGARPAAGGPLTAEPVDRADAVRRLASVAAFFRRTEPHSPVAFLVQRAMRWAEMPLDEWLREVVGSDDVLARIKDTLGIKSE